MALGMLYCVRKEKEDPVLLDPDDVTMELEERISWCSGLSEQEWGTEAGRLIEFLRPYSRTAQVIDRDGRMAVCMHIDDDFRRRYFSKRFESAKKLMSGMTLDDFCSDSFELYRLKTEMENEALMVHSEDFGYETFDSFVREAEADSYVIQDAVILH